MTQQLSDLAKHDVVSILDKTLKDDARKYFDIAAMLQFNNCQLRASTATSTTSITLDTAGTASQNGHPYWLLRIAAVNASVSGLPPPPGGATSGPNYPPSRSTPAVNNACVRPTGLVTMSPVTAGPGGSRLAA